MATEMTVRDDNQGRAPGSETDTIVLIHGLYLTARSWEHWIERYEARGYKVVAPSWPGLDGEVEALRADPAPIANSDVTTILDHYERIIRALPAPPIIMGHSFGGAFTLELLDRGLGAAGVAIDAAAVRGILDLPFSTIKSGFPLLRNPISRRKAIMLTPEEFNYAFTNTLTLEESQPLYDRYAIPGSRNVLLTGANANLNPRTPLKVDFKKTDRAPLLLIAGGSDHIIPASVTEHMAEKYEDDDPGTIVELKKFDGRPHFTGAVPGWEEVADYALSWAVEKASARTTA